MTVVVQATDAVMEQVIKQLRKLINVIKVSDLSNGSSVVRELAMVKVHATSSTRGDIKQLVDIFRAQIIDVSAESVTVEITGTEDKVESLLEMLRPFGLKELSRTGRVAMARGALTSSVNGG